MVELYWRVTFLELKSFCYGKNVIELNLPRHFDFDPSKLRALPLGVAGRMYWPLLMFFSEIFHVVEDPKTEHTNI